MFSNKSMPSSPTYEESTTSNSTMSSAVAMEPDNRSEEDDVKYESLRDMSQETDNQSYCSTAVQEEHNRDQHYDTFITKDNDDLVVENEGDIRALMELEAEREATIRKSCEEEILKYVQETEGKDAGLEAALPEIPQETANPSSTRPRKTTTSQQQQLAEELPDLPLAMGDHVYQWRSFAGCPGIFQHHGIVVNAGLDSNGEMELEIADFSCILRIPAKRKGCTKNNNNTHTTRGMDASTMITGHEGDTSALQGILRVYKSGSADQKWHKVHYKASVWKTSLWRSGTCTCVDSDPPAKVLARVYWLMEHPEVLPPYHIFQSNCECVSVFCKTGSWSTLQASSLLSLTAAGQLKSTATIAAYAASQQITVQAPAAGVWGYLGYTTSTQVSLLSTQPHLIPLLAAYGVVTAGGPTFVLWRCQRFWEATAERLNKEFWEHALKDPDIFARSMMHWSDKHKAFEGM